MLERVSCNVCGSESCSLLFKKKDPLSDHYFNVVMCSQCGLGYVNPRPLLEEMKHYYQKDYFKKRFDREIGITEAKKGRLFKLYDFYWRKFSRYYPDRVLKTEKKICNFYAKDNRKLLDIGCANGDFLKVMKDGGFEVYGLEFSDDSINKYGLNIFKGNLSDAGYDNGFFDLVTMWAVLEHVSDPMGYLREIERILKQNGVVIFLVPNRRSIPFGLCQRDDIPRHLYLFSPRTIKKMLALSNLTLKTVIHSNAIFYGGVRGCLIELILRALRCDQQRIDDYNKPIIELLSKKQLGFTRYLMITLSLADALTSMVLTPLLSLFRYNGIIIVVAEK